MYIKKLLNNFKEQLSLSAICIVCITAVIISFSYDTLAKISRVDLNPTDEQSQSSSEETTSNSMIYNIIQQDKPYASTIYDNMYMSNNEKEITIPEGEYPIVLSDLSLFPADGQLLMINETEYLPDLNKLLNAGYPISGASEVFMPYPENADPIVLILHTHGTEGFAEEGKISYSYDNLPRSSDTSKNIVSVGKRLSEILTSNGVPNLHCEIMHDKDSYVQSYDLARATIIEYTSKYPSIQYVLDIHRDAIFGENGEIIRSSVETDKKSFAQIMLVVGTDENGAIHPNWESNLTVATKLQYLLNNKVKNIARPINLRSSSFNEQYTPGSLLIEIGTCGNTLTEALNSAEILGNSLSELILSSGKGH